jgi:hypothetical protein
MIAMAPVPGGVESAQIVSSIPEKELLAFMTMLFGKNKDNEIIQEFKMYRVNVQKPWLGWF